MTASNIGKKGYKYSFKVHPGDGTVPVLEVEFLEDHSKIQVSFEGEVIGVATVDYEKDR